MNFKEHYPLNQGKNQQLFFIVIRAKKEDSAYIYFQMEASDGLCFYSTIPHQVGQEYRDIDIKGSIEFKPQLMALLNSLMKEGVNIEFLKNEEILDG